MCILVNIYIYKNMNSNVKIVLLDCTVTFLHKTFGLAFNKRTSQNIYVQRQRVLSLWVKTIHITDWDVNIWSSNIVDINLLQQWLWTQALRSRLQVTDYSDNDVSHGIHHIHLPMIQPRHFHCHSNNLWFSTNPKTRKTRLLRNINMQKKQQPKTTKQKEKSFQLLTFRLLIPTGSSNHRKNTVDRKVSTVWHITVGSTTACLVEELVLK